MHAVVRVSVSTYEIETLLFCFGKRKNDLGT